jgi:hypothetical protein
MDFLDLHQNYESGYHLVYGVPRFCHVSTEDFNFITDVDVDINRSRYLCSGALPVSVLVFPCFIYTACVFHQAIATKSPSLR